MPMRVVPKQPRWPLRLPVSLCLATDNETEVRQTLSKTYPNIRVGDIRNSDIPGLYEVEIGPNLVYFYPDKGLMVFGEIWTKEGKSLTAARREQLAAKRMGEIPLDKGIKIGSGRNTVIEFTDPDCPYCRKASEYLKGRNDTTRYVYFLPLAAHKDAENKARFILCSNDKAKAYEEVMSGKHDDRKVDPCAMRRYRPSQGAQGACGKGRGERHPFLLDQWTVCRGSQHPGHREHSEESKDLN